LFLSGYLLYRNEKAPVQPTVSSSIHWRDCTENKSSPDQRYVFHPNHRYSIDRKVGVKVAHNKHLLRYRSTRCFVDQQKHTELHCLKTFSPGNNWREMNILYFGVKLDQPG